MLRFERRYPSAQCLHLFIEALAKLCPIELGLLQQLRNAPQDVAVVGSECRMFRELPDGQVEAAHHLSPLSRQVGLRGEREGAHELTGALQVFHRWRAHRVLQLVPRLRQVYDCVGSFAPKRCRPGSD
jgi:hypothetical protein